MKFRNIILGVVVTVGAFLSSCETSEKAGVVSTEAPETIEEIEIIKLNQIPGEFTNGDLVVDAGVYRFEVSNSGVDHEVGLVVAPKRDVITETDHLINAYVTETVKDGDSQSSKGEVVLEKGEYVFFCPMNPTPQYTITVE